ncbi:uncharacterized protein LOC144582598 [Callithrix jacchus]
MSTTSTSSITTPAAAASSVFRPARSLGSAGPPGRAVGAMVPAGGGRELGARAQGRSGEAAGMGPGPGRRAALVALRSPAAGSGLVPPSCCAAGLSAAAAASRLQPPASRLAPPASSRAGHRPLGRAPPRPLREAPGARGVGLRAGPAPNWAAGASRWAGKKGAGPRGHRRELG